MPRGSRRTWIPPQRNPGESTRHYVMILSRQMRAMKLIFEDDHNHSELRQKMKNRWLKLRDLRDEAELPKERK